MDTSNQNGVPASTLPSDKGLVSTKKLPFHLQSSQTRLLIKNGTVVNADKMEEADVYVEDGRVKQIGRNMIIPGGVRTIDAKSMYVIPGGIDPNTHLECEVMGEKSADDFYTGTRAAVAGGTTMIVDFAIPQKNESLIQSYMKYRKLAEGKACCDFGFHVGVTSWSENVKNEMSDLCKMYGVNSFLFFLAYKDLYQVTDDEMYRILTTCKELGAVAMVHAENGTIIKENENKLMKSGITGPEGHELAHPEEVEAEAVFRACVFANQVKCPLYVTNVTSVSAAEIVKSRKISGYNVFGETLVSTLGVSNKANTKKSPLLITSPPIRSTAESKSHLFSLLSSGDLQVVSSDHCTFSVKQKAANVNNFPKIPSGVNGIEDRMSIIWEKGVTAGLLDPTQFVAITSTNAAKIFNLYPKKGSVTVGADADLVVWNPKRTRKISSKTQQQAVDYNIFEGTLCHGVPEYVIVKGRVCVEEGEAKATLSRGLGEFVQMPMNPPFAYPKAATRREPPKNFKDELLINEEEELSFDMADLNAGDSPSSGQSSVCSIPGSPVSHRSGRAQRKEGQRDLHCSSFSVASDTPDDKKPSIRVSLPPGGRSTGFW